MAALSLRRSWLDSVWCQTGRLQPSSGVCLLVALALALLWAIQVAAGAEKSRTGTAPGQAVAPQQHNIMARVNGELITRDDLASECLKHYGKDVIESTLNRHLIAAECRQRGITVSQEEVDQEIARLAERFSIPVDQWLKMLKQERGIRPTQYANDIIWPTLALRKLAGKRLEITEQDLQLELENLYGPSVRARVIVLDSEQKAREVQAKAAANPDAFGDLAKAESQDPSASAKGLIQPVRKHCGFKEIEQAAFQMRDGEVSSVIKIGERYTILKREQEMPGVDVKLDQVRPRLEEIIRDRRTRIVSHEIFAALQKAAQAQNIYSNPELRQQMPGVAAVVNGQKVTIEQLIDACIERHGEEVLEGAINRRLMQQALKKAGVTITEKDLDAEIARVASQSVPARKDGSPDVEAWLKMVVANQKMSVETYRHDAVWPTVALRKLVGKKVLVTEDDLRKGFEANYGPKVQCRAIVCNNARHAQRVWELARKNPDVEYFGTLAERYSTDSTSAATQGQMPPIKRYGGQPGLEAEAFALKKGEISGIIQVDDQFVVLYCEGQTKQIDVDFATVRDMLYEDIFEKKMRMAMNDCFAQLQTEATIDNFLANTTHKPPKAAPSSEPRIPPGMPILNAERPGERR
jgi:parvulin-like peptidyl-prolyl isomerase